MLLRFHLCRLLLDFLPLRSIRVLLDWDGIAHPTKLEKHLLACDVSVAFQRRVDLRSSPHLPRFVCDLVRLVTQLTFGQPLQQIAAQLACGDYPGWYPAHQCLSQAAQATYKTQAIGRK